MFSPTLGRAFLIFLLLLSLFLFFFNISLQLFGESLHFPSLDVGILWKTTAEFVVHVLQSNLVLLAIYSCLKLLGFTDFFSQFACHTIVICTVQAVNERQPDLIECP